MKIVVKWVVGSVCAWFGETSDCDLSDADAYLVDPAPGPHGR